VRELVRAPVKAAAAAAFIVGTLLFLLNPPSLSGAEGLVAMILGGAALVLLTAWATVALTGRQSLSEPEFERVVRRVEELAREPALAAAATEFELLVADAIDRLPPDFQELLENTPVVVSRRGAEHGAYGHYHGDTVARDNFPDRVILYQDTLERDFGHDPELLRGQVERTLRHELAHHLGWGERGVRELGL
jgi:predicted Zn-dependent protease with MMP-like domain